MVAHAIFVVLITGVPLSILVFMFTTGYEKLIEADELRIMVMLRQLDLAMGNFEMRKDWFVIDVADAMPDPSQSFEQLTKLHSSRYERAGGGQREGRLRVIETGSVQLDSNSARWFAVHRQNVGNGPA